MRRSEAELELMQLSAATARCRDIASDRARHLGARVGWSTLLDRLRQRKLVSLLGPRVLELVGDQADEDFVDAVGRAATTGARRGAALQLISMRIVTLLGQAGIRAAPLKGPTLSQELYGDPGRRASNDIDLLVHPEDLGRAVAAARTLGYRPPADPVGSSGLPLLHFALVHEEDELPPLELHWRIHWYERRFAQERLLPPTIDPLGEWRPAAADQLAALLLFYARDGFIDLRLATDIATWWDVSEIPRGALADVQHAYPALDRALAVACAVSAHVVGLPCAHAIGEEHRQPPRDRIATRLANPHPKGSSSQLYADMGLIDGLLAPPGGFPSFVKRQLFPPRDVLDKHAKHGARTRPRAPLSRGVGVLARYSWSLTRLVRPSQQVHRLTQLPAK
jgi:hypothetical protein